MAAKRHRLAQRRKTVGFTQEGLAEQLGVDPTTVRRWESGETETGPQPWLRPKLARYLQVSAEQLEELLSETGAEDIRSGLNVDEQQHVATALANARRYLDGPVVDYFRRQLDVCMANDGERGPIKTLPVVLGLLDAVEQHGREVQPAVRRELARSGSWASRYSQPANSAPQAPKDSKVSGTTAPLNGHKKPATSRCRATYCLRSPRWPDARDPLRVSTLAQAAQEGPWQLPTKVRAEVTQQEALGMAMLGEPLPAVERKLDDARQLLAQATEAYAKVSLKKYRPTAARNEDKKVSSGLL